MSVFPEVSDDKLKLKPGEVYSPFVLKCLKKIDIQKERTVIDIACGTGRHARLMTANGCRVVALDLYEDVLLECKEPAVSMPVVGIEKKTISAVRADATKLLPFQAGAFDIAIVIHFPYSLLFSEVGRILGKGGYLIYETIGRHGENWRDLPKLGSIRNTVLELSASILYYREQPAGPVEHKRGSVKMLAQF